MADEIEKQLAKIYAPAVIRRLSILPSKDQCPIAAWLLKVPVGTNYALQILEALSDFARREELSASQVLTQILKENFSEDVLGKTLPKEQGRQLRDLLQRRLHPKSSEHWESFQTFVKNLNLPKGTRLVPPKNFEGQQYHLDLCFTTLTELQEQLNLLQGSFAKNDWRGLQEF